MRPPGEDLVADYIQHSAHIEPGRDGLFNLIRSAPDTLRYEHQLIVAGDNYVIIHGRFSGNGRPVAWIAGHSTDRERPLRRALGICYKMRRPKPRSKSGLPMFGSNFPS